MVKGKKNLIIVGLILLISIIGISYAFFVYDKTGEQVHEVIAGKLYLNLIDGANSINLSPIFPQSVEKARARTDNILNFSIKGINETTDENLYYEINLTEGATVEGKNRFNAKDLRFDLTEIVNGARTLVVDNLSYNDLKNRRIWVNTVPSNTTEEMTIQYELRMWLSDSVLISDTDSNADYTTDEYMNSYANVQIAVYGDFKEKKTPYNYMGSFPTAITDNKTNISEVHFINITEEKIAALNVETIDLTYQNNGKVTGWLVEDATDSTKSILYVGSEGRTFLISGVTLFYEWTNLKTVTFANVDTSKVTSMASMFNSCTNLTNLDVSNWDVSNVTRMNDMFAYCTNLTELDLSNWDVSSVTNMSSMFNTCSSLTTVGSLSNWNVSNVIDMDLMFSSCSNLTNLDVSMWDVSNVTSMVSMFNECENLINLDVSGWDVGSVTNMQYMFFSCNSLISLDLSNWDVSSVTDMMYMFGCSDKLISIGDLNDWDVSSVNKMQNMFFSCDSLISLDLGNWDVSNVTDMTNMFYECSNLTTLDLSNWSVNKLTNTLQMFMFNNKLTTIYANNNWQVDATNLTNSNNMFGACSKLKGAVSYDSNQTDISMANPDTGYFTRKA